jgi:hypothetical protein
MYLDFSKMYFGVWLPQDLPSGRRLRLLERLRWNLLLHRTDACLSTAPPSADGSYAAFLSERGR